MPISKEGRKEREEGGDEKQLEGSGITEGQKGRGRKRSPTVHSTLLQAV